MLILSRYKGETIFIGDKIKITITDVHGENVRVGIEAPKNIEIDREEIRMRKLAQRKMQGDTGNRYDA